MDTSFLKSSRVEATVYILFRKARCTLRFIAWLIKEYSLTDKRKSENERCESITILKSREENT